MSTIRIALLSLAVAGAALADGRAGNDSEEEQALKAAEAAFSANQYEDAAALYEKVTAIDPARPEPWVKRAVILYRKKQYNDAVQLLRTAQKTLPDDLGIKAQLGLSLYKAGAVEIAVGMMEEVVRARPEMSELQLQLGLHYVKVGDGKKAVPAMEAYFKYRPAEAAKLDAQLRPIVGSAYLLNKQYTEAEREFEAVLKLAPNDPVAHASLGLVETGKGDCNKAIAHYEKVAADAPKRPFIAADLATCYLKLGRRGEALKSAEGYAALRPKEAKAQLLLGDARFESRDLPGAQAAWAEAHRLDGRAPVDARLGRLYLAQKNYDAALGVLERAAQAAPDDLEIARGLAEAYAATRAPRDQLVAVGERLAKAGDAESLVAAGGAFFAAGDDARAAKLFDAALALDGKARRARTGLQMALTRAAQSAIGRGDLAAAEKAVTRARELDPEGVQANRNLGLVLIVAKKYAEAERPLQAAAKKVPHDVVVNRLLGRAYAGMKRRDDAIKAWEEAAQTALRTRGPALAEVYVDLGPAYVEAGKLDQAIGVLDTAVREAGQTAALAPAQRNLALALYRRGLERMKDGKLAEGALEDLSRAAATATAKGALTAKEQAALSCAASLGALAAGKSAQAEEGLARAVHDGGCTWKPPFEKVGSEFFAAYADYRDSQSASRREAAAKTFQKLVPKASASLAPLLRDLVRSSYELEGYDLYQRGEEKRAAVALRSAAKLGAGKDLRELENNLAVIDTTEGHYVAAEKKFEELGARPPESMVNLGILVDREGDARRALELYRRGAEHGAHAPRLREWIDVKERLLSSGDAPAGGAK